jgi:hypothetical protein
MKTDHQSELTNSAVFLQTVSAAMAQLKRRLQQNYEQAYPDLREIIYLVVDEEETNAWSLSLFPHLLLPDLVEAHIAKLDLCPAATAHDVLVPHDFTNRPSPDYGVASNFQPALALCG